MKSFIQSALSNIFILTVTEAKKWNFIFVGLQLLVAITMKLKMFTYSYLKYIKYNTLLVLPK